jgi:hypothetical protein
MASFTCDLCNYTSKSKSSLTRHLDTKKHAKAVAAKATEAVAAKATEAVAAKAVASATEAAKAVASATKAAEAVAPVTVAAKAVAPATEAAEAAAATITYTSSSISDQLIAGELANTILAVTDKQYIHDYIVEHAEQLFPNIIGQQGNCRYCDKEFDSLLDLFTHERNACRHPHQLLEMDVKKRKLSSMACRLDANGYKLINKKIKNCMNGVIYKRIEDGKLNMDGGTPSNRGNGDFLNANYIILDERNVNDNMRPGNGGQPLRLMVEFNKDDEGFNPYLVSTVIQSCRFNIYPSEDAMPEQEQ